MNPPDRVARCAGIATALAVIRTGAPGRAREVLRLMGGSDHRLDR
ncbi:MAG: hypothetical protein WD467_02360 [Candidatus Saccharimonadales bacterium]